MPKRILLIFPPFGAMRSPYASLPALAGYLQARDIQVRSIDANVEFFHRFLTPQRISEAQGPVEDRFLELNAQERLSSRQELDEYACIARTLSKAQELNDNLALLLDKGNLRQKIDAFFASMSLASLPYWPEFLTIDLKGINVRYRSAFSPYSTKAILQSLDSGGLLAGFFEDLLYPAIESWRPEVIGLSAPFPTQIQAAFRCARAIKRKYPDLHIVLGGAYVSCCMRDVSEPRLFDVIDSMVIDDGEEPLERLVNEIAGGRADFSRVPALVYRVNGGIRRNPPAPPLKLETLPAPDFNTLDLDRYLLPRESMWLPLRSSRGCAWARCAFCRTDLPVVCHHEQPPADYLCDCIRRSLNETGANNIAFTDEAASPATLERLSRMILKEKLNFTWAINVRLDPKLTLDRCLLYRAAGCLTINTGLETCNDRLLRLANKGITIRVADAAMANIAWAGMGSMIYMIVGFPTETEAEALHSQATVERYRVEGIIQTYKYNPLQIVRHSAMAREPERFGITRLNIPPDYDLAAPILDFECAGMSRATANRLCVQFNSGDRPPVRELRIKTRAVPVKHDLQQVQAALLDKDIIH